MQIDDENCDMYKRIINVKSVFDLKKLNNEYKQI